MTINREPLSLRERKRLAAMRAVQSLAIPRFLAEGFDAVTVEEIAEAAEVAPVSVYRYFGTKEGIVLWDEYDPPILEGVAARLQVRPPLEAIEETLIDLLDEVYATERELVLDRTRLTFREPKLLAAADANVRAMIEALAGVIEEQTGRGSFDARILAAVAVSVMVQAVGEWQRKGGTPPLAEVLRRGFAVARQAWEDSWAR